MNRTKTTKELAEIVGGELIGRGDIQIASVGRIEHACSGEISFVVNERYAKFIPLTKASCILVPRDLPLEEHPDRAFIRVEDPYRAFNRMLTLFAPPTEYHPGFRGATAFISPTARISDSAYIGEGACIGERCVIGDHAVIHANVTLYCDVKVGKNTVLHSGVVCYEGTVLGSDCIIHAGTVIGADGFGFLENKDGSFEKIPQLGNVVIHNEVEIGANCTIDRATLGSTVIGTGVKIDNLVHVAHNVSIGENTAIAAQTGISGSTRIGERNRFAGQVGIVGHISTANDVIVQAQSGISKTIKNKGQYFGSPAKEHAVTLKMEAALRQLPQLLQEFRELKQRVHELERGTAAPEE